MGGCPAAGRSNKKASTTPPPSLRRRRPARSQGGGGGAASPRPRRRRSSSWWRAMERRVPGGERWRSDFFLPRPRTTDGERAKDGLAAKYVTGRRTTRGNGVSTRGFVLVKLRERGRNFPSPKRSGVNIRSCWREVFSNLS